MNFIFVFEGTEVIKAAEYTKECDSIFQFISDSKVYSMNTQFSFIFSKKVEELILSDMAITKYKMKGKYTQEFLDIFFSSIIHNKIYIENQYIDEFIRFCSELKVKGMNKSIEFYILSHLCNSIQSNIQLKTDEEMYDFLCANIQKLNLDLLKGKPFDMIWRIITNSKYSNEDEFALLILNQNFIEDENLIDFIQTIKFEDLSLDVYEKVLSRIQDNEDKSLLVQNLINRGLKEISKRPIINLLNITDFDEVKKATNYNVQNIDFNFLTELNPQNNMYKINVTTISFKDYEQTSDDYLNQFNFLILGGCDGVCWLNKKYFSPKASQKIIDYNTNKKGVILLLHDIHALQGLLPLYKFFGYKGLSGGDIHKKVEFIPKCDKLDIITSPFVVGTSFVIAPTHQCPLLDPAYTVFTLSKGNHYYSERLDKNIAECSLSHSSDLTAIEKKFICNAVCHLFNHYQTSMKLFK